MFGVEYEVLRFLVLYYYLKMFDCMCFHELHLTQSRINSISKTISTTRATAPRLAPIVTELSVTVIPIERRMAVIAQGLS